MSAPQPGRSQGGSWTVAGSSVEAEPWKCVQQGLSAGKPGPEPAGGTRDTQPGGTRDGWRTSVSRTLRHVNESPGLEVIVLISQ